MIELPESHKYLAGDYMRENPMYSAREVRELIAEEREACAKVCETEAAFSGSNGKKDASALNCADAIRMRSNV